MDNGYIAVLDSGIGGISVMKDLIRQFPNERFLYYGDNDNAPYGNKTERELLSISLKNIDIIKKFPIKALVLGCNTLSTNIRCEIQEYASVPTFGIFPPVEQAVVNGEKTLLLATPLTAKQYYGVKGLTVVGLKNLAKDVEDNMFSLENIDIYKHLYIDENTKRICKRGGFQTVILGCTHYDFVKNKILDHFRPQKIINGNHFLIKNLKNFLEHNKSIDFIKRFDVLFLGKNAEINRKFYVSSGQ